MECVRKFAPDMLQKVKVHLLLHLPDNLMDFGPPANYNNERYYTCSLQHGLLLGGSYIAACVMCMSELVVCVCMQFQV